MAKKKKKQLSLPLYEELKDLNASLFNDLVAWETPDYIRRNMIHMFRYYGYSDYPVENQ